MLQKAFPGETRSDPKIILNGTALKCVNQFKYLGAQISNDAGTQIEVQHRIKQAAASFSKLYERKWKKRHITLKTKVKTYTTIIIPCLIWC